jgi:hypothetical protein
MKKTEGVSYLINEPSYKADAGRPVLLRIEMSPDFTKVDFGYQTNDDYFRGGWVRIDQATFIRNQSSNKKYQLIRAENIPIAPDQHHFSTIKDWLYFSLYFQPLPLEDIVVDLIEDESDDKNNFNYYQIQLKREQAIEVLPSSIL